MSRNIHWSYNDNSYRHGIICRYCIVNKYDIRSAVHLVHVGTLIEIVNVQENIVFRIVKSDKQVDDNLFICEKGDVLFVPENLWGPLLTVEEQARLSIVQDSQLAEALGNITVGSTVKVLGPDFKEICVGSVKFKNSITKLGMGVYFGLNITYPTKDLQVITELCSLLRPRTKGFPRGCDIVVSVDKIRPINGRVEVKNLHIKEGYKSTARSNTNTINIAGSVFNIKTTVQLNDKTNGKPNYVERETLYSSATGLNPGTKNVYDIPLSIGEQVVSIYDNKLEKGTVRWIGKIENSLKIGIEFENPIGSGTGNVDGIELFRTKNQHAALMPPESLIKLSDIEMNNSKDYSNQQKTANNNNYNNLRSNGQCCSCRQNPEGKSKMLKINSFQKSKYVGSTQCRDGFHIKNCNDDYNARDLECSGTCKTECTICISQMQYPSKSFDLVRSSTNEKKIGNNRQSRSMDNDLCQNKELFVNLQNSFVSIQKSPSKDLDDSFSHNWTEPCELHNSIYNGDFPHGASNCNSKLFPDHYDYSHSIKKKNIQSSVVKDRAKHGIKLSRQARRRDLKKMSNNLYDRSYIPLTVLEQCGSNNIGVDSSQLNHWNDGFYDVPSSAYRSLGVHRGSCGGDLVRVKISEVDLGERYKKNFYKGRRHTLSASHYNKGYFREFTYNPQDLEVWETQNSEQSSSDESGDYYDTPKPFIDNISSQKLGKGSVIELLYKGQPYHGVIRWVGTIPDDGDTRLIAGIEMEEERSSFTDGTFRNKRYFSCNPKKALFVPLSECRKDSRFIEENKHVNCMKINSFGQVDCPVVEGTIPPISFNGDLEAICGKNRGIQGHHNSCYLDATLFAMFAFTSVFDSLLYRPPTVTDIPQYSEVQRVLKEEIVNPLRKNLYVRADRVMKLRTLLENLSSVSGLTCDEKDPEEFLNSLLAQILRAEPFLKLSSGQETFHYQLFVEKDERLVFPSVQQLFEQSFVTSDIKLKQIPSCLIIQMPRFGKSFKMYSRIFPPQLLDVTDIIENSPRQCTVCGKLAEYECKDCFGQHGIGSGLESISYCKTCLGKAHSHHCRVRHNFRSITVPFEFHDLREHCTIPRINMELYAVVCIETSHYVAFVKCGTGSDAPWCFFDSMADRKGEQNGYNIPEMVACPDLPYWLSEEGMKTLNEMKDERQLPEHAKRLLCDAYMCMYQSPDIMMYR